MRPIAIIGICLIIAFITSCGQVENSSDKEVLFKIERQLGMSIDSTSSIENRLERISKVIDRKLTYRHLVFVAGNNDTIVQGRPAYFTITHHLYFPNIDAKVILYKDKESMLEVESKNGLFDFSLENYNIGDNKYVGAIFSNDDSLYFECAFHVVPKE